MATATTPSALNVGQWAIAWDIWYSQIEAGQVNKQQAITLLHDTLGDTLDAVFQSYLAQMKLQLQQAQTNIATQILQLP